jgi:NADH:ubiquinone oxidoreductase subunit E
MVNMERLIKNYSCGEITLLEIFEEIARQDGYVSFDKLNSLSRELRIPLAKLYEAASFYSFLPTAKQGKYIIRVCNSPSCYLKGSKSLIAFLKKELKIGLGETTKDGRFTLKKASCMGCCDKAPAMLINGKLYCSLNKSKVREILRGLK